MLIIMNHLKGYNSVVFGIICYK